MEKLYRKANKTSLSTKYYVRTGGDYRHERNKKIDGDETPFKTKMVSKKLDRDYTPLFRFLISKVGQKADDVLSVAKKRSDYRFNEVIGWIFETDKRSVVGGSTKTHFRYKQNTEIPYLKIDEDGLIQYKR